MVRIYFRIFYFHGNIETIIPNVLILWEKIFLYKYSYIFFLIYLEAMLLNNRFNICKYVEFIERISNKNLK